MIEINVKRFEGSCVSITNGNIKISTGENISISSFKEKEIHIHGDVNGNVDCNNLNVRGNIKGDVDGTNISCRGHIDGNIDGTNVSIRR